MRRSFLALIYRDIGIGYGFSAIIIAIVFQFEIILHRPTTSLGCKYYFYKHVTTAATEATSCTILPSRLDASCRHVLLCCRRIHPFYSAMMAVGVDDTLRPFSRTNVVRFEHGGALFCI